MNLTLLQIILFITIQTSYANSISSISNRLEERFFSPSKLDEKAEIVSVTTSGIENNYTFNVGVKSKESGCDHYTNWWEIVSEDGKLIYRRILAHSHTTEQPFIRSGSNIKISKNEIVIIRAHMNTNEYGTIVFKGSISSGFTQSNLEATFALQLSQQPPLPDGCAF